MGKRKSQKDFINECTEKHGHKYDYSLIEYIDSKTKVKIICKEHGVFEQIPTSHTRGRGCKKCQYNDTSKRLTSTTIKFIETANIKYGNLYNYSLVNYISYNNKVKIICKEHGNFYQTPYQHIYRNYGCPKCSVIRRSEIFILNESDFINKGKEIHNNKYDYSSINYISSSIKVNIICAIHGEFKQLPHNHLMGKGCKKCSGFDKTREEIIDDFKTIHGDKYDYSLVEYKGVLKNIKIICPTHGIFEQTPSSHKSKKQGCPKCNRHGGLLEDKIYEIIKNIYPLAIQGYKNKELLGRQHLDIFIPEHNIAIEYQGKQHFEPVDFFGGEKGFIENQERDQRKRDACARHGIKLFYFSYDLSYVPNDYPYKVYSDEQELLNEIEVY